MRWTSCCCLAVGLATALAGCAGAQADRAIRTEGPRMVELFRGTARGGEAAPEAVTQAEAEKPDCSWLQRLFRACGRDGESLEPVGAADVAVGYTRTALNELELLFPRLPNPDIVIYVYPHLATEERVPVPGYTTAVPLYERVEYALPGEVEREGVE